MDSNIHLDTLRQEVRTVKVQKAKRKATQKVPQGKMFVQTPKSQSRRRTPLRTLRKPRSNQLR